MSSLRSSVRPKSSKQPWGTIMQPEFGLGYQKMTEYEIAQTVDRLYKVPTPKERVYERPGKKLEQDDFDEMVTFFLLSSFFAPFVASEWKERQFAFWRFQVKFTKDLNNGACFFPGWILMSPTYLAEI